MQRSNLRRQRYLKNGFGLYQSRDWSRLSTHIMSRRQRQRYRIRPHYEVNTPLSQWILARKHIRAKECACASGKGYHLLAEKYSSLGSSGHARARRPHEGDCSPCHGRAASRGGHTKPNNPHRPTYRDKECLTSSRWNKASSASAPWVPGIDSRPPSPLRDIGHRKWQRLNENKGASPTKTWLSFLK
jgi:hypothetical protein